MATRKALEVDVERLGLVALDAEGDVELEAVRRNPAELASPAGLRRSPQDDAAARSAALVCPDEELPALLANELDGLGRGHDLHGANASLAPCST